MKGLKLISTSSGVSRIIVAPNPAMTNASSPGKFTFFAQLGQFSPYFFLDFDNIKDKDGDVTPAASESEPAAEKNEDDAKRFLLVFLVFEIQKQSKRIICMLVNFYSAYSTLQT